MLLPLLIACASYAQPIDIDRFDVRIHLDPDGTMFVTETIAVDFHQLERHGIYRTIPVNYSRPETVGGATVSTRYALRLRVLGVADEEGSPLPYDSWPDAGTRFIRIGDPDRTVTGKKTYAITYRVQRAINRFEEHDELYWNVTGTEWNWPIHRASVEVHLPAAVSPERVRHETFTGLAGSTTTRAMDRVEEDSYHAEVTGLGPGEGLTIVLGLEKGVLLPPSVLRETWWKLADNVFFLLAALMPILALALMTYFYFELGRDPGRSTPIVVQYEPPEDLSPAEVGTLLDERVDVPDLISIVIDLAVRGYLRIEEVESTTFLFFSTTDYRFEKSKDADDDLSPHEALFLSALFRSGDSVLLSSLKDKFYTSLPAIAAAVMRRMISSGLFSRDPGKVRRFYRNVAAAAVLVPSVLGILLLASSGRVRSLLPPEPFHFFLFAAVCLVLTWAIVRLFANAMPVRTAKGARLLRHCLGFQEFVSRVEKERLERMMKDDPTLFERVLPYAIVLGVADQWAERFAGLLSAPPSWYRSDSFAPGRFRPALLVSSLGSGMHVMGSTFTSRPRATTSSGWGGSRSSAGRGFSGFGGGGRGSSGGGFGGGGGGSW
jgi:uncharacterized membrane protein